MKKEKKRRLRRIADSYRNILMYEHIAPEIRFSAAEAAF